MGRLILLELIKLRTVRTPVLLLTASLLVVAAGAGGLALSADELHDPATAVRALGHAGLASLVTLVLGVMAVAGEHRTQGITDTYLSTPRRSRVIAAKLAAYALAGALFAVANAAVALITAYLWWTAEGVPFPVGDAAVWRTVGGCIAWNIAFTLIGVGLGALIRNLTAALITALAWLALLETTVGQLFGDLARRLPFASGSALAALPPTGSLPPLSQSAAALTLTGYAALFALLALVTVRRDVT